MKIIKYRYRKVTPEIELQMKQLRKEGKSYDKIAEMFNVRQSTVIYHVSDKYKKYQLKRANERNHKHTKKEIRINNKLRKKYRCQWFKDRYHDDEEFRKKVIRANSGGKYKDEK